jgi:hypothetical protein
MVGIIASFVTCDDKKTHLISVSNLLRERLWCTQLKNVSFINAALTTVQVVDSRDHTDHSPPSSAEVKNESELYLLSLSAYVACKGQLYFCFIMLSSTQLNSSVLLHGPHIYTSSYACTFHLSLSIDK